MGRRSRTLVKRLLAALSGAAVAHRSAAPSRAAHDAAPIGEARGPRVVCAVGRRRAHKTLLLLEGLGVTRIKSLRDLLAVPRGSHEGQTVVMIDNFGKLGLLGLFATLYLRAPLVLRLRGHPFREQWDRATARRSLRWWLRYVFVVSMHELCLRRARLVIFNSETVARELARYASGRRRAVVHNPYTEPGLKPVGEEEEATRYPEGGFRLLTVTNMNLASKVEPTLEAIRDRLPPGLWEELDLRWVVCGSGFHEERVRRTARKLGIEERLLVPGRVEAIGGAYEWCDVLVYLTRLDAFPNVPMEAMMHEKPVIANADSHGTREQVVNGVNGLVVQGADELVAALRLYAHDPELRRRHGRAGRALVEERFSVEAQRRAMRRALETLFDGAEGR